MGRQSFYGFRTERIAAGRSGEYFWTVEFSKVSGDGPTKLLRRMTRQQHSKVALQLLGRKEPWSQEEIDSLPATV